MSVEMRSRLRSTYLQTGPRQTRIVRAAYCACEDHGGKSAGNSYQRREEASAGVAFSYLVFLSFSQAYQRSACARSKCMIVKLW
jgi:hypothetical protein